MADANDVVEILLGPVTISAPGGSSIEVDTTTPGETTTVLSSSGDTVELEAGTTPTDVVLAPVLDGSVTIEGGAGGGATGPQGPQGPPGTGSTYNHVQMSPSSLWSIDHELGGYPAVTVIDSSGRVVFGDVTYVDANHVTISFGASFGGRAALLL